MMGGTPHGAVFSWSEFEDLCLELAHAKLLNRHQRDPERMRGLGAELSTIREIYMRAHARAYPGCTCGKRCWQRAMDAVPVAG